MIKILVLCTGNSCRSQIAEGYLRKFAGNNAEIFSAGIETHGVNPLAIIAMQEDGIDISKHTSNNINEYSTIDFDYVITVCDNAQENCPYFPSKALRLHYNTNYNYILVQFNPAKIYGNPQVVFILSASNEFVAAVINSLTSSNVLYSLLVNFLLSIAHIFSAGFSSGL